MNKIIVEVFFLDSFNLWIFFEQLIMNLLLCPRTSNNTICASSTHQTGKDDQENECSNGRRGRGEKVP